jgi:cysteinyl-tRNA synthetase
VSLRLYDTAEAVVREFVPRRPGVATIYLCGATVQSAPHIGHIRSYVSFDVLHRWLLRSGYDVIFARNVTDVEDKIIAKSAEEGIATWRLAYRNERAFNWAYDTLGCLPPTVEPRATGHLLEMFAMIQRLIDGGHAYVSGGDVYFDVSSWPDYGTLSHQRPEDMLASEDADELKRDVRDFALWKAAKPGEPAWESPWGSGRPGWHIECSAMAERYLGAEFDIHGAGRDLIFPHNENERAQSKAAGNASAAFWMHNGLVTDANDEKMSKSLGNSMLVSETVQRVRPVELRYYLLAPHYRSPIRASEEAIEEAAAAYRRLETFIARAGEITGPVELSTELPADFVTAMDDDLSMPRALAVVHDAVRDGNRALAAGDKDGARAAVVAVRSMLDILGLDPQSPHWRDSGDDLSGVVDALVQVALAARQDARARKDFAAADAIRDQLAAAGVTVEDTPNGPRWSVDAR